MSCSSIPAVSKGSDFDEPDLLVPDLLIRRPCPGYFVMRDILAARWRGLLVLR
jgi:hypothetical protein